MRKELVAMTSLVIAGCAAPAPQMVAPEAPPPTCSTAKECEAKWSAARRFVLDTCGYKLQHYTDDFMETFTATDYSTALGCRVTKEPISDTSYRLLFEAACANMFGCHPAVKDARNSFNLSVQSAWSSTP